MWSLNVLSGGVFGMILNAGPVAKAVMVILLFFSIVSWTIIFFKIRQFNHMEKEGNRMFTFLENTGSVKKLVSAIRPATETPYHRIILLAYKAQAEIPRDNPGHMKEAVLDAEKRLQIGLQEENERLEKYLSFLATTANTAPFVGLFGTVWGIMDSFREIGLRGTTSLAVVAPGISEALIATAFGLATAIPAVVGYNYLLGRSRRIANRLENFATYALTLIQK